MKKVSLRPSLANFALLSRGRHPSLFLVEEQATNINVYNTLF